MGALKIGEIFIDAHLASTNELLSSKSNHFRTMTGTNGVEDNHVSLACGILPRSKHS